MKSKKRIIRSGDSPEQIPATEEQTEDLLSEMSRLYRERFRALYNQDTTTLKTINERIDLLKTKLTQL